MSIASWALASVTWVGGWVGGEDRGRKGGSNALLSGRGLGGWVGGCGGWVGGWMWWVGGWVGFLYLHGLGFLDVDAVGREAVVGRGHHLEGRGFLHLGGWVGRWVVEVLSSLYVLGR